MSGTSTGYTFTSAGLQPQAPASLYTQLLALVATLSPGYTARLPGSLIDDVSGTAVGALTIMDQAAVEFVASLLPINANPWLLTQLAQIYLGQGSTAAPASNTGAYVVFSGTAGFPIQPGFLVSDGTYQYTVQDGGAIETGGSTQPLLCLATQTGSWAVPANTVNQVVTSVPVGYTVTCNNPLAGIPGGAAQTQGQFRAQVVQAGLAASTGMTRYLKTLLQQVSGVQSNLISARSQPGGGWEIIVGGTGDTYAIGNAIFESLFDVSTLVGSTILVTGITNANPGVVTTNLNHGYTSGQTGVEINGALGMTAINGTPFTVTVITEKTFSVGVDTTSYGAWTSGGIVTPNFRNTSASIYDYPDTYTIPIVIPPSQNVTLDVTWNTLSSNYVNPLGVAQLVQGPLSGYINGVAVGQPINELEMTAIFQSAVSGILDINLLDRLVFTVYINTISTAPGSGTYAVYGDPESYFVTTPSAITVTQG